MSDVVHQVEQLAFAVRMKRAAAERVAADVIAILEPACERIEIAGSLRRGELEVGDIEIVCIPRQQVDLFGDVDESKPHEVQLALETAGATPRVNKLGNTIAWGRKQFSAELDGAAIDVFCVLPPAQWGVILALRTGPAEYSRWLVAQSYRRGKRFVDGRLLLAEGHRAYVHLGTTGELPTIDTPEEVDVFRELGIDWVEPCDRPSKLTPCCGARRIVHPPSGDHGTTRYYVCAKCRRPT